MLLCAFLQSLPLRECGLKSYIADVLLNSQLVTPLAGVWIEIRVSLCFVPIGIVTPLAGVWIEISVIKDKRGDTGSLPLRECGLKSYILLCYWLL